MRKTEQGLFNEMQFKCEKYQLALDRIGHMIEFDHVTCALDGSESLAYQILNPDVSSSEYLLIARRRVTNGSTGYSILNYPEIMRLPAFQVPISFLQALNAVPCVQRKEIK